MKKIFDYIKAHPCITIVHTLGILLVLLCFFYEPLADIGARNFIHIFSESGGKRRIGIVVPCLGFGAYSASNIINRERESTEDIKLLEGFFFVLLWFFVFYTVSWLLYRFGYYS